MHSYKNQISRIKVKENTIDFEWETEKLLQQKEELENEAEKLRAECDHRRDIMENEIKEFEAIQNQFNDQKSTLDESIKETDNNIKKLIDDNDLRLKISNKKLTDMERVNKAIDGKCQTYRDQTKKVLEDSELI